MMVKNYILYFLIIFCLFSYKDDKIYGYDKVDRLFKKAVEKRQKAFLIKRTDIGRGRYNNSACFYSNFYKNYLFEVTKKKKRKIVLDTCDSLNISMSKIFLKKEDINISYSSGKKIIHDYTEYELKYFDGTNVYNFDYYDCYLCSDFDTTQKNPIFKVIYHFNKLTNPNTTENKWWIYW